MNTKAKQAGRRLSLVDCLMLALVAAGLIAGGLLVANGRLLTGFLVAAVCIMAAAAIGELTNSE